MRLLNLHDCHLVLADVYLEKEGGYKTGITYNSKMNFLQYNARECTRRKEEGMK
jgi:hypothetical protein